MKSSSKAATTRHQPLHIPLSFGDAIRGLLKVDPKQLPASAKRRAVKKKALAKRAKKVARKKG